MQSTAQQWSETVLEIDCFGPNTTLLGIIEANMTFLWPTIWTQVLNIWVQVPTISQIRPKYSLYFILTGFSNSDNFWSRPPISLSKVTFGIYRSKPIVLRGHRYANTLWKYNKCVPNTICIWFGPICQMSITFDPDLRFQFQKFPKVTNRCRSSWECANSRTCFGNTVCIWYGRTCKILIQTSVLTFQGN